MEYRAIDTRADDVLVREEDAGAGFICVPRGAERAAAEAGDRGSYFRVEEGG